MSYYYCERTDIPAALQEAGRWCESRGDVPTCMLQPARNLLDAWSQALLDKLCHPNSDACEEEADSFTEKMYRAIGGVRQEAAQHGRSRGNLYTELHKELWAYVQVCWEEYEYWSPVAGEDATGAPVLANDIRDHIKRLCRDMEEGLMAEAAEQYVDGGKPATPVVGTPGDHVVKDEE